MSLRSCPNLRRYRLVLIDESHNLRNREGKRYRAIQEYIEQNDSKCILLSATPYNKTYLDLSSQLRLFVAGGRRPRHPARAAAARAWRDRVHPPPPVPAALAGGLREERAIADDWRELMRLYLVRRTRSSSKTTTPTTDPSDRPQVS